MKIKTNFPFPLDSMAAAFIYLSLFLCQPFATVHAESPEMISVGNFSSELGKLASETGDNILPKNWEPLLFKKIKSHTRYKLMNDNGTVVVSAESKASSSGLMHSIRINSKEYPFVQWKWKIGNLIEKGDVAKKSGDDYPARIYITFEYDGSKLGFLEKAKFKAAKILYGEYPPMGAINYIWANRARKESIIPNAYTNRVIMVVVESGSEKLGAWVTEKRNIHEDYKQAFGHEPPMISGVAIMTDTDNTGESTTAYYGDIIFAKN